jgi:glycosyltransferase involved in cell wall biosynthesis
MGIPAEEQVVGALLSVVMPAYNEEGAIRDAVRDVQTHVLDRLPGADMIVVDDGSRDRTGAILDQLALADPRVRIVHQPNGGHGSALRRGLDEAGGEWVFLIDSDRQIPLDAFMKLWDAAQGRDGAFGMRTQRHDPRLRLWLTRVVRGSLGMMFGVRLYDANVPCKLLRRAAWLQAAPLIPRDTLAPSLFLAVFMKKRGMNVAEVGVQHLERTTGTVSIRRWKLFKFCWKACRQMVAFRARLAS